MRRHLPRNPDRVAPRGLLRLLADSQSGFSVIEVVISAMLIAIIASWAASAMIATNNFSADQRRRSQADALAQKDQERLQGMSGNQLVALTGNTQTQSVTNDGTAFRVTSSATFLSASGAESCASSGGAADYYKVVTTVDWLKNGQPYWANNGRLPVVEQSVITPSSAGNLTAKMNDQDGNALAGVTVTANGPENASATTDATGCVILMGLTPGTYTVSAAKGIWVDPDGNAPTTKSVTTTETTNTNASLPPLGAPGSVTACFFTPTVSSNCTGAQANDQNSPSLSWLNSGMSASAVNDVVPATSPAKSIATPTRLFPFYSSAPTVYTNNYTVWAGKCPGEEPPNDSTLLSYATVAPGSGATAMVREPAMIITVRSPSSTSSPVDPLDVRLIFSDNSGCSETWAFSGSDTSASSGGSGSLLNPGQPFASLGTSGTPVSASGKTGSYTVCADYDTNGALSGGVRWARVTGVTNSNFSTATTVPDIVVPTSGSTNTGSGSCPSS